MFSCVLKLRYSILRPVSFHSSYFIFTVECGIDCNPPTTDPPGEPNMTYTYVAVSVAAVLIMVVVVIFGLSRRKTAQGITWFPEGFILSNSGPKSTGPPRTAKRRVPDGEEMKLVQLNLFFM